MKNPFLTGDIELGFVNALYKKLMNGEIVTYEIVYEAAGYTKEQLKISNERYYGELKKAFSNLTKALKEKCGNDCLVIKRGGRTGNLYWYVGDNKDPLAEERKVTIKKYLNDYVDFCKKSNGLLPPVWISSFFDKTQMLYEMNKESQTGTSHISSTNVECVLTNLELMPTMNMHITDEHVVKFDYKPFDREKVTIVFHPQYLKESNGRWFVFGKAEQRKRYPYVIALDRICSEVSVVDKEYSPAKQGYYKQYFADIVGVKRERHSEKEIVTIRTKTNYIHGLINTKRLHHSQIESVAFGVHEDGEYGEITIDVIPNRELIGRLLNFGDGIEVMSPESVREEMKEIICGLADIYDVKS